MPTVHHYRYQPGVGMTYDPHEDTDSFAGQADDNNPFTRRASVDQNDADPNKHASPQDVAARSSADQAANLNAALQRGDLAANSGDVQAGLGWSTQSGGQRQALEAIGRRAFGGPSASLGARQTGKQAAAYEAAAPAAQAAAQGASLARGLAGQVGAEGGAQRAGTLSSGKLGAEDAGIQLASQAQYGDLGGSMNQQNTQLAQFNASQLQSARTGEMNDVMGIENTQRDTLDQKNAQVAQGATSAAMAVLSLLAMM